MGYISSSMICTNKGAAPISVKDIFGLTFCPNYTVFRVTRIYCIWGNAYFKVLCRIVFYLINVLHFFFSHRSIEQSQNIKWDLRYKKLVKELNLGMICIHALFYVDLYMYVFVFTFFLKSKHVYFF